VYAGTSSGFLTDSVLSASDTTGAFIAGQYDGTFANVTALGVGRAGALDIVHDPSAALTPGVPADGQAELFERAKGPLNPAEAIFASPASVLRNDAVSFHIASPTGTTVECRLDQGQATDCDTDPQGGWMFGVDASMLDEGSHSFTARATDQSPADETGWGATEEWRFTVDRTAPANLSIDPPSSHTAVGGKLKLAFSAIDPAGVSYACAVDTQDAAPCSSGKTFTLALGTHTISVVAKDGVGNESAPVTWDVEAIPAPIEPQPQPQPGQALAPAAPAAAPAGPRAPLNVIASVRVPRIEIGVPCVEVSASRARAASLRLAGDVALVRFRAPANARFAKFTLRRSAGGRKSARVVETLAYARIRQAGAAHSTRIALTRGQRRLVRSGAMRLAIAYGTCRTQVGQWQWIPNTSQESPNR
jgi:hypothetical protein